MLRPSRCLYFLRIRAQSLLRCTRICDKHVPVPRDWNGVVAQLVERLVRNEKVAGSSPVGSTIPKAPQGRFIPPPLSFTRQIQLIFAVLSLLQSVPAS